MTTSLTNNAFALDRAWRTGSASEPATAWVRDGNIDGTLFTWVGGEWIVSDLDNGKIRRVESLAVVTLDAEAYPADSDLTADSGLSQCCLGCDLESPRGEFVVSEDEIDELLDTYEDALVILWSQGDADASDRLVGARDALIAKGATKADADAAIIDKVLNSPA